MWPQEETCPAIPYDLITPGHRVYDLVYNPVNTLFLSRCQQKGALIHNGMEMLHQQADHAWLIWKQYGKF
jgi:shikimate dehydrogenase